MSKLPFTRFFSPFPLSKEYSLINNKIVKKANVLSRGLAKTIRCSFQSFYNHLINADAYTAFGYGISKHQQIKITSKKSGLADDVHYMTRSKANYQYPEGCGIMMLDYDPSAYSSYQLTFKKFRRILADIHPDLGECACIVRDSVSAGVYLEGQLRSAKGFHVYIPVLDATDIPRFGKLLHHYFWLHGYGYIALSKDGKLFERSPIDVAVFSPERLDFVGEPIVNSPLQYQSPRCQYFPGFYLDTSVLKSKSLNQKRVDQIIQQAKKQIRPQQQQVQHEYDHQQVLRLVERGHSAKEAEAIVARNRANDYQFLDESHTLYFSNGIICSVKEAIEQDLFGTYLADPIEGTEYGTTTAQLIKRYGQPFIRSFAHGGRSYRISFQKAYNLNVLSANPGYGKTRAIHHRVRQLYQDGEYICLVVPTKKLMSQYTQDLIQVGFGLNSIQAISSEDNSLSVGNQLGFAVKDNERLILITHACLKLIKPAQYKAMAHYHVFIDEVFDPLLSCKSYSLKDAVSDDGILKALCDWAPIESVYEAHVLRAKKSTTRQLSTQLSKQDGKHALSTKEINHVLAAAKDSTKQVIISKMKRSKKHNYCIAELYNGTHLKYFKSCTIASAFVQETALYHWCSQYFNMVDVTAEYSADFQDLSARMKKLTVMPFVDHYTKHVRNTSRFTKHQSLKTIKTQTLVNRIIQHCSYFDEDTLRVMNNDDFCQLGHYEKLTNGHEIAGQRISSQVHGQNQYQHLNSAIIVAAFNLQSHQTAFLKKLLPDYDPWLERNVLTTIQCLMRTSLRNKHSKAPVYALVPDQRTCDAIIRLYNDLPSLGAHCLVNEYEAA